MKQINVKKLALLNLPYVFLGLYATKLGQAWRLAAGADASEKLLHIMDGFAAAFQSALPSFHPADLVVGLLCGAALRLAVYMKGKNAKKYRHGMEYGTARWGSSQDIAPYIAPKFEDNIILTQTERLTMNSRSKDPKTARNKNVLVIGGSGSGKTRFFLKPNLMQCTSKSYPVSFVVTDPKGDIVIDTGKLLQRNGYRIKILNTINFKKSMHYNPFAYLHSEKDILKLVTTLIANTKGEGKGGDDFWIKAETLLYTALIGYIYYEAPKEEQNFSTLIEFINAMEVREDDEEFKNPVDLMFDELAERDPNHFAVRQYAKYRLAAGKTAKSILVSCGARLAVFDIAELREVTAYDELELDTLGDRKTALFLIMSDTDDSFNFLISILASMETAGAGDMPEDAERRGIGTPATRAAILEKLVASGLVERKKAKKITNLLPTQAGSSLVTVLPEALQSPMLTAEWEQRLGEVERGTLAPEDFMDGIAALVRDLVRDYQPVSGWEALFPSDRETVGPCPRCGGAVTESKKGFFCENRECRFVLWKDSKFFSAKKKQLTKSVAASLLKAGRVKLTGCWSEKTGKTYDATVILEDDGERTNYKLVFGHE